MSNEEETRCLPNRVPREADAPRPHATLSTDFGFPYLSWSQCHWVSLSLAVVTLTLALVTRLAHGPLGVLSVPVWLFSVPSALHSYLVVERTHAGMLDASAPWMLLFEPIIVFSCCCWTPDRPRFHLEYLIVATMLAKPADRDAVRGARGDIDLRRS